ncbi:cytochrome c oxidase assembly protein [Legionella gresilensis]|uniref:cytochrome c oxidase assembly protein n=1 Tax=Legionella gresilensis TaxID=91823 RepID=UPI00104160BE|nr:cytochrome c oxidase assembly protein [Legionella gresilensis]
MIIRSLLFIIIGLIPNYALAHNPFAELSKEQLPTLLSALCLALLWFTYSIGALRIWPGWQRFLFFQGAILITIFTIFGGLDELAETNTAAHMAQHMLMMVVIAPIYAFAQPLPQLVAATSRIILLGLSPILKIVRYPIWTAALHGLVIWFWHAPKPYLLALNNPWWHIIEHLCFLITAGLFWWSILYTSQQTTPRALLALLFTLMHTGFLGALLTFAQNSIYGPIRSLQSQQLAGLIMWVIGGIPYLVATIWCGERWFKRTLKTKL